MYIYSGKCRMGTVGQPTNLKDWRDKPLFVGDIVTIATHEGTIMFDGLSAVVGDEWQTYWSITGEHGFVQKYGEVNHYIMGIKNVDFVAEDSKWIVIKVKDYSDVIDGEHWKDYGFSYHKE